MAEKVCKNQSCSMKDRKISTDRTNCVGCGRELTLAAKALTDSLFGENFARDFFGMGGGMGDANTKAKSALRKAEHIIDRISNGKKVTRGELRIALDEIRKVLDA